VINVADVEANELTLKNVELPYYYENSLARIKSVRTRYVVPKISKNLSGPNFYAVLFPYPIQGGLIFVNGHLVYSLEHSDEFKLFNWYQPITINLPVEYLSYNNDNVVVFEQTGHLRSWPLLPIFFGKISELRGVDGVLYYLSQTLASAINFFCGIIGFFLTILGFKISEKKFMFPGLSAIFWASLFTIAMLPTVDFEYWFYWRLSLYFLTGNLILFSSLFISEIFKFKIHFKLFVSGAVFLQLGWLLFLLTNGSIEYALDMYWTGLAVFIYIIFIFKAIFSSVQKNQLFIFIFLIYLAISGVLAIHDFLIQAGIVLFKGGGGGIFAVINSAIYLSHFSVPAFLIAAGFLLLKDFCDNKNNLIESLGRNSKIKNEIISDIHDGVGARLNVLLLAVESNFFKIDDLRTDIRRCIDELRFVLTPDEAKVSFTIDLIVMFCNDIKIKLHGRNINFDFVVNYKNETLLSPRMALAIYLVTLESLSNVLKHAVDSASLVGYSLNIDLNTVTLSVEDNGVGLASWSNEDQKFVNADTRIGLGVKSIINRIKSIGGKVLIFSELGKGTALTIFVEF